VEAEAATEEAAEEEAPVDESQEVVKEVVEESEAVKARELEKGITVVSDEDVSTLRTKRGGEYRDVDTSDAVSFHLYLTTDRPSHGYQGMVYTGALLRLDENTLEYIPNMAEAYSISEDGLTFTFHLRQGMKWSDGQPITAHDFKWTYDQATNPDNEFPYLSQLEFITSYEALDDYTLEIKIDKVYAPALGQMSGLITPLPKHVWENLDWSDPETNPEINSPSVVSGPYRLVEWKRDQFVIFEANENYWYHGSPNIQRYVIEIVPDQDIAYQKMKGGETDTGPITPENLEEARQLDNITVYEWWPAAPVWWFVGLNMREGFPTHDIQVRHGLSYAVDKQLLTDEVMRGQAKRLCSAYPDTSWVYNPDVPCYEYDLDKAIEEFAQAGYTFQEGKMLDENGQQLQLSLLSGPPTSQTRQLIALAIQADLKKIGIEVEIQALEWSSFMDAIDAEEPDWDMYFGGWSATIEPHIMYTIWAEENIPSLNSVAYVNKEVEALFEEAGATYDTEFRKERYQEIQRIIAEESPYIFLYYQKRWSGENDRIKGIEPTALGIGWNMEDWYIEEVPAE
jgi:peptide/nickel transport system substrate-binding protein